MSFTCPHLALRHLYLECEFSQDLNFSLFIIPYRHLQTIRRAATKKPSKDITQSVTPNLDRSISMPPPAAATDHPQNLNQVNNNLTAQGKMLPPLNTNLATNNSRESDIDITPTELKESIGIFENPRRASCTSYLLSPGTPGSDGTIDIEMDESSDRFYLLKKDSERRQFLVVFLDKDKNHIIDAWYKESQVQHSSITKVKFTFIFFYFTVG